VASEVAQNFDQEAELHEEDADALVVEAACVSHRADIATAMAEVKDKEAALEQDEREASRLRFEGRASRKEAQTLGQVVRTLLAQRERAVAKARTARTSGEAARTV
jgi:hypothetical protein